MHFLKFKIFAGFEDVLKHGLSTRSPEPACPVGRRSEGALASLNLGQVGSWDSEENLRKSYRMFCSAVGVDDNRIVSGIQKHTDRILVFEDEKHATDSVLRCFPMLSDASIGTGRSEQVDRNRPGNGNGTPNDRSGFGWDKPVEACDGFITNIKNLPLMVRFADCQGVLFFDPISRVVAAVHSGWRGNVQNIIGKAAKKMVEEFGCSAENILVGISQSLGPCHAEFGDPVRELPEWMQKYVGKNAGVKERHVDLWQCSFDQLTEEGVLPKNIEIMRRCTVCENDTFFSYRVEGEKCGRMGGVIELG